MTQTPFRVFLGEVARVARLSPSFVRVTVTGPELDRFADNGYDQRIKLVLPVPGRGLAQLPTGPDWYQRWRELPEEDRPPVRTYTVRAVRPASREVDVDLVRHGDLGPATRWAGSAAPGDPVALVGPDAGYEGPHGGVEFRPPPVARALLLAGDETAVPAIASILERLAPDTVGEALLEVPHPDDALALSRPAGLAVSWLPRHGAAPGSQLVPAVEAAAGRLLAAHPVPVAPGAAVAEVDVDRELLWEVPEPAARAAGPYAWLAGEAAVIRTLRRHLVTQRGLDRAAVAFMGYWRQGRAESS